MNNAKYSKKFDVFVADPDELCQISNMDLMIFKRKIAGFAVFQILFGWTNPDRHPLYKIKMDALKK